ncbi:MAG: HAD-IIIC family phosphatase [Ignavibacteriales bacterium]|nr:HAD-IIIC family phosphatase [Ignavibacteriales bacterium]
MAKSEKIENNVDCPSDRLSTNCQNIENSFLCVFINNFVNKFRNYNNDEFLITISGLKRFIYKDEKALTYLFEQLKENNFIIEFEGNEESVNHIDITCKNITKKASYNFKYQIHNLPAIVELSSKIDIPPVGIIITKIVAQIISKIKILYKAIVLDLDDTLWKGTLSEVGKDKIRETLYSEQGAPFIAFMKFVKTLANELGVFITICSRNDSKMVESTLELLDENIFPLKYQIDYIIANNNDKSDNIRKIAEELSILPQSLVFIDDNQIVRDEVKRKLPDVFVPEWENHNELVTQLIAGCIFERGELSLNSQNRRKQYKIIQTERAQNSLPKLFIKAIRDNDHIESCKLYSKSNQFKISAIENFDVDAKSLYFEIYRENGENLGICSTITYSISEEAITLINWAISCRYFQIGIEEFVLLYLQKITNKNKIYINYQELEYNLKVKEMLQKYCDEIRYHYQNTMTLIEFTEETVINLKINTKLKEV